MATQKTISIVLPSLVGGGAERVNLDLGKGFKERGINVEFVLRMARGELLDEARQIGPVVDLKSGRVRNATKPLTAYIKERRPDALLVSMWPLTTVAVRARAMAGHECTTVLAEHGVLSRQYASHGFWHNLGMRLSLRYAADRATAVTGVSEGVARDLAKITGKDFERFKVIYNPISAPIKPTAQDRRAAEALWNGGTGKRIVTVGRLKTVKNQELLIDAFAQLDDTDARLMIVGDGELRSALEQRARDKGVGDRVIFVGFQPDPAAFYATANVFALSSWSEGFGNVIVEAMGHGLPIVSTDCPTGPKEILEDGRFGWLTPPGDAAQMAVAMAEALANPVDAAQQIVRAAQFRPEIAVDGYLQLLLPDMMKSANKAG